jgi:hypothetical protein
VKGGGIIGSYLDDILFFKTMSFRMNKRSERVNRF